MAVRSVVGGRPAEVGAPAGGDRYVSEERGRTCWRGVVGGGTYW